MPLSRFLAFDIETVPDPAAGRRVLGLTGEDGAVIEGMLRARLNETKGETEFLKPPFHKIIELSVAIFDVDAGSCETSSLSECGDEPAMLSAFLKKLCE